LAEQEDPFPNIKLVPVKLMTIDPIEQIAESEELAPATAVNVDVAIDRT